MFKRSQAIDSILGAQMQAKGEIKTNGTIRIDGTFEGIVEADCFILGESAQFKGEITAREVMVGGKIDGQVIAKELVDIKSKGQIIGDVKTQKLVVAEGGIIEGHFTMHHEDFTVVEFPHKKEY